MFLAKLIDPRCIYFRSAILRYLQILIEKRDQLWREFSKIFERARSYVIAKTNDSCNLVTSDTYSSFSAIRWMQRKLKVSGSRYLENGMGDKKHYIVHYTKQFTSSREKGRERERGTRRITCISHWMKLSDSNLSNVTQYGGIMAFVFIEIRKIWFCSKILRDTRYYPITSWSRNSFILNCMLINRIDCALLMSHSRGKNLRFEYAIFRRHWYHWSLWQCRRD